MVNEKNIRKNKGFSGEPPSVDESWWEAVLSEGVDGKNTAQNRLSPLPNPEEHFQQQSAGVSEGQPIDWEYAERLYLEDKSVDLFVTSYNRGGVLVNGSRMQGFVPLSHLVDIPSDLDVQEQEKCLAAYANRTLALKVIECDQQRGRVVFSERAALAESGKRNLLLSQLKPGQCVSGTVTNVTDFGVFVDLGGIEGLVHVSEISWGRVRHPSEAVKVGDQVRVHVLSVDHERSRIALSLKRLCPNPWETVQSRYFPGQVTEAIITSIVPFGAFARLEEGLDGLIHVSEIKLAEGTEDPFTLTEGQHVRVRVLQVDAVKQRLGLSLLLSP